MGTSGVSLALSAGGARGFAHIGVIKVLERYQIPVTGIAGTSMGGLIGALYCTGFTGLMMEELVRGIRRSHWIDFSLSKMGLVRGKKLEGLLSLLTRGRRFEDCRPPLQVVAVDIERGQEVLIRTGSVAEGVRATISIPGIFSPVRRDGRILVDGGILNRVPVDVARSVPNSVVVAVDVGVEISPSVHSVFDVLFQTFDIMAQELRRYQTVEADVVIEPNLSRSRDTVFSHVDECIRAGEEACIRKLPNILALLNKEGDVNEEITPIS